MNLFFEHVLFSIDNWDKLRTSMRFEKYLDMKVATGDCKPVQKGIGKWWHTYETCYLMDKRDFDKFVKGTHWVKKQECFALIPGDNRQPVVLIDNGGNWHSTKLAMQCYDVQPDWAEGWTYMNGKFWRF